MVMLSSPTQSLLSISDLLTLPSQCPAIPALAVLSLKLKIELMPPKGTDALLWRQATEPPVLFAPRHPLLVPLSPQLDSHLLSVPHHPTEHLLPSELHLSQDATLAHPASLHSV